MARLISSSPAPFRAGEVPAQPGKGAPVTYGRPHRPKAPSTMLRMVPLPRPLRGRGGFERIAA
jgi:hypothetical protein